MASPFHNFSRAQLSILAEALANGWLAPPFLPTSIRRVIPGSAGDAIARELNELASAGVQPEQLSYLIRVLVTEREAAQRTTDRVELVWTGPESSGSASRDTGVVVRELFAAARESVDIAGFTVYNGRIVFKPLAENMEARPELRVRLFLNVPRKYQDTRAAPELLREFAASFLANDWPGARLPTIYHDPRALSDAPGARSSLHAKCIVVDDRWSFITSANFTEAAQERNIEAGVLIEDRTFSAVLRRHLDGLATVNAAIPQGFFTK